MIIKKAMMNNKPSIKYLILTALFGLGVLTSCIDDDYVDWQNNDPAVDVDIPEEITKGYSLSFVATLDALGDDNENPMRALESYIDPEKFRVLFFNSEDKFLFESKSRWVKRLPDDEENGHSRWFVSVPFFTFGNELNEKYDWNWNYIKKQLTSGSFKIAILANRPDWDWAPQFDAQDSNDNSGNLWYDNSGPHWTVADAEDGINPNPKRIFDIHHSQFDPIYTNKSWPKERSEINNEVPEAAYYAFIMEKNTDKDNEYDRFGSTITMKYKNGNKTADKLNMSSVSSWVDWGNKDDAKIASLNNWRYFSELSETHPIPMYGIQKFLPINPGDWKDGATFYLNRSDDLPISLLRSVVKLELKIPVDYAKPEFVIMFYPNVFARCEPMNIWTPTNELWEDSHGDGCADWKKLVEYGPVVTMDYSENSSNRDIDKYKSTTLKQYQERMAWFYGAWREDINNMWDFDAHLPSEQKQQPKINDLIDQQITPGKIGKESPFPQIFNSCIQRNTAAIIKSKAKTYTAEEDYGDGYYHYVVYTGERNINDPSYLNQMGRWDKGASTICYWRVGFNSNNKKISYSVPITDFTNVSAANLNTMIVKVTGDNAPYDGANNALDNGSNMEPYEQEVRFVGDDNHTAPKPWPLIRNHVYTLTLDLKSNANSTRSADNEDGGLEIRVKSKEHHSKSLKFKTPKIRLTPKRKEEIVYEQK